MSIRMGTCKELVCSKWLQIEIIFLLRCSFPVTIISDLLSPVTAEVKLWFLMAQAIKFFQQVNPFVSMQLKTEDTDTPSSWTLHCLGHYQSTYKISSCSTDCLAKMSQWHFCDHFSFIGRNYRQFSCRRECGMASGLWRRISLEIWWEHSEFEWFYIRL